MSLTVYLTTPKCPHCGREDPLFDMSITHNLGNMADSAGIYRHIWRPEEIGIDKASQLIVPLETGLLELK